MNLYYYKHKASFHSDDKKSATTLAAYIHNKGLNPDPTIKWEIVQTCPKYAPGHLTCSLCLSEKFHIVQNMNNTRSLNKRTDIGNKCTLHRKKHYLSHITWNNRAELGGAAVPTWPPPRLEITAESSPVWEEEWTATTLGDQRTRWVVMNKRRPAWSRRRRRSNYRAPSLHLGQHYVMLHHWRDGQLPRPELVARTWKDTIFPPRRQI